MRRGGQPRPRRDVEGPGRRAVDRSRAWLAFLIVLVAATGGCYLSHADPDDAPGRDSHTDDSDGRDVPRDIPGDRIAGDDAGRCPDLAVIEQVGITRADIVLLVDNSSTMGQEQVALTMRFPELINDLVDPPDIDPADGRPDHPAIEDLNIGIITPDMGTMGFPVPTCENPDFGDNGCFRHESSPTVPGCAATLPLFLWRNETNAATYTPAQMAQDFTCIATLGTAGCNFEQPFKAMRQALTVDAVAGGCNSGFLRPDSILALIFVTDEDDCSVRPEHPEMFDSSRTDLGTMNIRCFLHPDRVESVADYVEAFRSLHGPDETDRLVVGMIVGVPPDAPQCLGSGDELTGCLDVTMTPAMREQIDPADPGQLVPSCNTSMGLAFPPVRFVELAMSLGANAYVESICKSDWRDAIRGITDRLPERMASTCLPVEPPFDPLACRSDCVLLEMLESGRGCSEDPSCPMSWCPPALEEDAFAPPPCIDPSTGATCEPLERPLGRTMGPDGRLHSLCLVRQAPRTYSGGACRLPSTEGWYYLPAGESPERCPEVMFGLGAAGSLIDAGSTGYFRCPC